MTLLYHASFFLFLSFTAVAVIGSAAGLVLQAWLTGGQRRWDIVIVVGSYIVLAVLSIMFTVNRVWSIRTVLETIPKAYIPVKEDDIPKKVYQLISTEYSRASVISYVARPKGDVPPGWGAPGTDLEHVYFPRDLLDTIPALDSAARSLLPSLPPLRPHVSIAQHLAPVMEIWNSSNLHDEVRQYDELVQRARYFCPKDGEGETEVIGETEWREGKRLAVELGTIFSALSTLRHPPTDVQSHDFASSSSQALDVASTFNLGRGSGGSSVSLS